MYLTQGHIDMKITDSFGQSVYIKIPKHVKRLGISMSGGADSSLLCYLVVKYLQETKNNDVVIHPVTCNWGVRPWSIGAAKQAVKFIKWHTGFENFGYHYRFHIKKEDCIDDGFKEKTQSLHKRCFSLSQPKRCLSLSQPHPFLLLS